MEEQSPPCLMKYFKPNPPLRKFQLVENSLEDIDFLYRTISTRLTLYQKFKEVLKYPLKMFRKKESPAKYIEVIRAINYLVQEKAYLTPLFLFRTTPEMLHDFDRQGHTDLARHTPNEVFGYLRGLLMRRTTQIVAKDLSYFLQLPDTNEYLPQLLHEFTSHPNPYKEYVVQMLLKLMICLYEHRRANKLDELTLIYAFLPIFFNEKHLKHLQTKDSGKLLKVVRLWRKLITHLPRGRVV